MKENTRTLLWMVIAHLYWRTAAKSLNSYWSHSLHYLTQRHFSYGLHTPLRIKLSFGENK